MLKGLTATGTAWLWVLGFADAASPIRFLVLGVGLLAVGAAVWIRLGCAGPAWLEALPVPQRRLALLTLACAGVLMTVTTTGFLVATFAGAKGLSWSPASVIVMWCLAGPWGAWLGVTCLRRSKVAGSWRGNEESAAVLTLAGLAAFAASWALYLGPQRASEWDSLRLLLSLAALVALAAAPLMVVPQTLRRAVISVLVLVHFGGITTAVMSAPPTPWLIGQVWTYFYRPYLEFMYLNNAYHFYSPEPGPASYLWFRIESQQASAPLPAAASAGLSSAAMGQGSLLAAPALLAATAEDHHEPTYSYWLKVPDMDDNTGTPRYPVALAYQRMLAMTENTTRNEPTPSMYVPGPDGLPRLAAFFDQRVKHSPLAVSGPVVLGHLRPDPGLIVPFHPEINPLSQYQAPNLFSRRLIESFARFVMQHEAARRPELRPLRVKVYRVVHVISTVRALADGWDPCFPTLFLPYYMGEFDRAGAMTRRGTEDPFLYWLVPILKEDLLDPHSRVVAHVFRHAGEPAWVLPRGETKLKLPADRKLDEPKGEPGD
jgi:hypothetical protein